MDAVRTHEFHENKLATYTFDLTGHPSHNDIVNQRTLKTFTEEKINVKLEIED